MVVTSLEMVATSLVKVATSLVIMATSLVMVATSLVMVEKSVENKLAKLYETRKLGTSRKKYTLERALHLFCLFICLKRGQGKLSYQDDHYTLERAFKPSYTFSSI